MSTAIEFRAQDNDSILPSQYNDLIRRRSSLIDGEYRLLWAVLEDAIRTYLANKPRLNPIQRKRFEEVRRWFEPNDAEARGLFDFRSVCELLGIEPRRLLKGLKSLKSLDVPPQRPRLSHILRSRNLAA